MLHDLLTAAECDELVRLGRPELEASTVVDTATGSGMLSQVRTSSGMFITDSTEATLLIRKRISHITLLPEENQEAISVLRYQPGQYYKPHQVRAQRRRCSGGAATDARAAGAGFLCRPGA